MGSPYQRQATTVHSYAYLVYLQILYFIYQYVILRFNISYAWKCSTASVLEPFFIDNFSRRHLDCGVANGYFCAAALQQMEETQAEHKLTLLDIDATSLELARVSILDRAPKANVQCVRADVTAPLPHELKNAEFDSISLFNLLHCIPGGREKLRALKTYKNVLSDDGVLFGCTVLGAKYIDGWLASFLMRLYNSRGLFNNWEDTMEDIEAALIQEFSEVETFVVGMEMVFKARGPIRDQ
ncbi:methyltransferase [Hypoxylon rubiginosum]|uniref:Methyltransferase n=1 Tax=Hypoxylon rubiginosum TaxID=110542 RepID=A0ACC0CK10_9PEZI|nr:methyltransferase [Hypoxylon rubiginosum]